ncbi:putative membrane protein [Bradyrhizobium sp. GM5.1]
MPAKSKSSTKAKAAPAARKSLAKRAPKPMAKGAAKPVAKPAVKPAAKSVSKAVAKAPTKPVAPKVAAKPVPSKTASTKAAPVAAKAGKWVFTFGDGKAEGKAEMRDLLGGKGANLAEMANLGLPVPPGFTIPTSVCTYFYAHDKSYPK